MNFGEIQTERLRLHFPQFSDAEELFTAYATDPMVTKYLIWRPHRDFEESRAFIASRIRAVQEEEEFYWTVRLRTREVLIGAVALHLNPARIKAEVGHVFARPYWNKGYATEAVGAMIDRAYSQEGMTLWRIWGVCDIDNQASARVLEKVGMQKERVLRRWISHPNVSSEPRDCLCYSRVRGV